MSFRVGIGYDVHQLKEDLPFTIGGIKLNYRLGPLGHSDADVLIHAICDALLGAANLGDIGTHFPDTDPKYKGIDSKQLLTNVVDLLKSKNYEIGNLDTTVVLELPKLKPHIPAMRKAISKAAGIPEEDCSIKATTNERIGFVGREEGIAAYAVALIRKVT